MARIDRILALVVDQGANELRVGTNREPQMFAYGTRKRLMLPATADDMLRDLLGEILSPANEADLQARGQVELDYDAGSLGAFRAKLTARPDGIDVVFVRASGSRRTAAAEPAPPPPSTHVRAVGPPSSPVESAPADATASVPALPATATATATAIARPIATAELEALVARAVALRASDVHLLEGDVARVRIDGQLRVLEDAQGPTASLSSLLGLSPADLGRLGAGKAIDLGLGASRDVGGTLRTHVYRTSDGLAAAIRLLPPAAPALGSLGIRAPLQELVGFPHGLVLVCGPTGSGKSTTLAALAQHAIERRSILLVTLEDPIEYHLRAGAGAIVRRRQVGRDVMSFAAGLREALREDLDVMLVGELRDAETIQLALTAAETGHLVLASIHSRSATSAIARVVDAYPAAQQEQARSQLADALRVILGQRLLPRLKGSGRVPAIELLRATSGVTALIREGKLQQLPSAIQSGRAEGMTALERSLATLIQSGEVDPAEARAAANDPGSLESLLRHGSTTPR